MTETQTVTEDPLLKMFLDMYTAFKYSLPKNISCPIMTHVSTEVREKFVISVPNWEGGKVEDCCKVLLWAFNLSPE